MDHAPVAGLAKPVSRIVLGTMIINRSERERSFALLDAALALGVDALDTAHGYAGGDSERCIGEWMAARGVRDRVVVLTKGCHPSGDRRRVTPFDLAADLHDSLARLKTDHVDLWMLHRDDPAVPVGEIVDALDEHRRAGRIRAYGGSNWTHQRLAEANAWAAAHGRQPFTCSSPNFGLAEQVRDPWGPGCVTISGPQHAEARAWYRATRTPVFAYSSLARGLFSGRIRSETYAPGQLDDAATAAYAHDCNFRRLDRAWTLAREKALSVPQVATAWLLRQPLQAHAIVGAATPDELAAIVAAAQAPLSEEECAWLDLRAERTARA